MIDSPLEAVAVFAVFLVPLVGAAYLWRIFPHRPFVYLLLAPAGMAVVLLFAECAGRPCRAGRYICPARQGRWMTELERRP